MLVSGRVVTDMLTPEKKSECQKCWEDFIPYYKRSVFWGMKKQGRCESLKVTSLKRKVCTAEKVNNDSDFKVPSGKLT